MKLLSLIIEEKKKMHKITPVERKFLNLLNKKQLSRLTEGHCVDAVNHNWMIA